MGKVIQFKRNNFDGKQHDDAEFPDFASTIILLGREAPDIIKKTILDGFEILIEMRTYAQRKKDRTILKLLDDLGIYIDGV